MFLPDIFFLKIIFIAQKMKNAKILNITTLAPVGILFRPGNSKNDKTIPKKKHDTATIADEIVTVLKRLKILMEVKAGKIIRLEIRRAPIMRIPSTIVRAVKRAMSIL